MDAASMTSSSKAALRRLVFRLVVIVALAAVWPGPDVAAVTALLCLGLSVGCLVAALVRHEPIRGAGLNHWFEAAALALIAASILWMRGDVA
jgi:hypothetical protein